MVSRLVTDLLARPEVARVVVTENIPEGTSYPSDGRLEVRRNRETLGYGANQNAVFADVTTPFFCVLNPDIRLAGNPFPELLAALQDERIAASAPVICTPDGRVEDSARRFPTLCSLLGKAAGLGDGTYAESSERENPDWLAGMFLLFRSSTFRELGGFDEKYFLYYEDVDLCWRVRQKGHAVRQLQKVKAIHDARRASRRDWRHARWHLASMTRFLGRSARD